MNPAEAMGTFLRVWRRDWARMSRAQLALAVSSACGRRKTVTGDMVYAWEEGQPPKTAAELVALTKAMRRHRLANVAGMGGLSQVETRQFREVTFAALAGRQYPELFGGDSIAYDQDVAVTARAICARGPVGGPEVNIAYLVAWIQELRKAVRGDLAGSVSRRQQRSQQAALAFLTSAIGERHMLAGRLRQAIGAFRRNAEFLSAYFGANGLGWRLSVLGQQWYEAEAIVHEHYWAGRPVPAAKHLLQLSERAATQGDHRCALDTFFHALRVHGAFSEREHEALLTTGKRLLESTGSMLQPRAVDRARYGLFEACLATKNLDDAARYLGEVTEGWSADYPLMRAVWEGAAGDLALARGDYNEAQVQFERQLNISRRHGMVRTERWALRKLRQCDRARSRGRRNCIPQTSNSSHAQRSRSDAGPNGPRAVG